VDGEPHDQGDDLPEELDVTAYVGPYVFPDIRRRRIAAALYVIVGGPRWRPGSRPRTAGSCSPACSSS
jgi:hypothetical protein